MTTKGIVLHSQLHKKEQYTETMRNMIAPAKQYHRSLDIVLLVSWLCLPRAWAFSGALHRQKTTVTSVSPLRIRQQPFVKSPLFFYKPEKTSNEKEPTSPFVREDDSDNFMRQLASVTSSWNEWLQPTATPTTTTSVPPMEENNSRTDEMPSAGLLQMMTSYTQPIQAVLDEYTSGWALSYANLAPETPETVIGRSFLASNLAYVLAGVGLQLVGQTELAFMTEIAALASFQYHFQQLDNKSSQAVRLALLIDYVAALFAMGTATIYLVAILLASSLPPNMDVLAAVGVAVSGLLFLGLSWKYEAGRPYILWHSLWHFASAYSGFLIGNLHSGMF